MSSSPEPGKTGYADIRRCNRCGFCQSVCPTYAVSRDETQVARGRIHWLRLWLEGRYDRRRAAELREKAGDCLLCRACVVNCPAEVRTDELMRAARRDFSPGWPLFHRLVYRGVLSRRERLERVSALLRLYEKSGAGNIGRVLGRALDRLAYYESFMPDDLEPPARLRLPKILHPAGRPRMKVLYFLGCASNVFGARTVLALTAYLLSRGVELSFPAIDCCGAAHRAAGDDEAAARLAGRNLPALMEAADFIVSDCSTCAHTLAHYDEILGPDSPQALRIRPLLPKVMEINTLISERLGLAAGGLRPLAGRATYHDACHAVRGLGVREAPRALLGSIPGLEFKEMAAADSCCGGAGSYCFSHPGMSTRIAEVKAGHIRASGAGFLAASCPACALQLGAALRRGGRPLKVVHPAELLAWSAGFGPK